MWLIFLFIYLPWKIQTNGQYPNWASANYFSKSLLCWKLIRFGNLDKTYSFLPAFLQREETYSFKFKYLSIATTTNFCFELSQIFPSPIRAQTFSCVYPETKKWHLSWFSFMQLLSNHSIAKWLSCSDLQIKVFKLYRKQKWFCHLQNYRLQWIQLDKINDLSKC